MIYAISYPIQNSYAMAKDMDALRLQPDVVSLNAALNACAAAGDEAKALEVMEDMSRRWEAIVGPIELIIYWLWYGV